MTTPQKSTRWSFTAYENQYGIIDSLTTAGDPLVAEIGYQDEVCPDTGRKHRQGYVRTNRQVRFKQLADIMKGVHLEVARDFLALKKYCAKTETRDPTGKQVATKFERPMRLNELMEHLAGIAWDIYDQDRQTDSHPLIPPVKDQYITLCSEVLMTKPEYISILAQPIAKNAWYDFRTVWVSRVERAREESEKGVNSITTPGSSAKTPDLNRINVGDILTLDIQDY